VAPRRLTRELRNESLTSAILSAHRSIFFIGARRALSRAMLRHLLLLALVACASGCAADIDGDDDADGEDVDQSEEALGAARHKVIANVDNGGGVILANRPGGFYMGRLLPGMSFDRDDAWYLSKENGTNYAWGMAWGHSRACLYIGPSRGKIGFTAGKWASPGKANKGGTRCTDAQKRWLSEGDAKNIASHFNCPPPSSSAHGTEKTLLRDAQIFWNVDFGGKDYEGGAAKDPGPFFKKGTKVWYRYTTRDGKHIVVFVPGTGWGFMNANVLDRSQTGTWSFPEKPTEKHKC
jgi:hypothetical protein